MQRTAHISFDGGGLILPHHTPYDRELVFEHLEASARQHQHVVLSAKGRHWRILLNSADGERCGSCARLLRTLVFRGNGKSLCGQCVRHVLM
jgi:hypothetical protein